MFAYLFSYSLISTGKNIVRASPAKKISNIAIINMPFIIFFIKQTKLVPTEQSEDPFHILIFKSVSFCKINVNSRGFWKKYGANNIKEEKKIRVKYAD